MKTNIKLLLMREMMISGIIRRGDNELSIFTTMNKDYIIELRRNDVKIWNENSSFQYLCKIIFKNNLNIPVLELVTSEADITSFLEVMYTYMEFNSSYTIYTFNSNVCNLNSFSFEFVKDTNNNCIDVLFVNQFDPVSKVMVNRIKIEFDNDSLIEFFNQMYFIFLIDIDDSLVNNPDFLL